MITRRTLSRREFLGKATAAGAALAFPALVPGSARGANGSVAPSNRIAMGALGIGWQGSYNLMDFLSKPEVQVVAVCDIDENHLEAARRRVNETYGNEDCATYRDFRQLLGRGDLDAVSLALPDHWHAIPAIEAARAGLDIYSEKPLSYSLLEGRAICNAVKRYGRIWQTGSWQRSRENFHYACQLVRNGRIGKVRYVEVGLPQGHYDFAGTAGQETPGAPPPTLDYDLWLGPAPVAPYCPARVHKNWRWNLDYGGGQLLDWVGHHLDIAHWALDLEFTGPVEIQGTGRCSATGIWNTPTDYEVLCKYAHGLEILLGSDLPGGVKWYGQTGWIHVNRGLIDAVPKSLLREVIGPDEIQLHKSRDHVQDFLRGVRHRQATIAPCEVAHRSASVGHLALISILTGRRIQWDPEKEEILNDPGATLYLSRAYREPWHLP
ncbi:MAG TPA: Gfo/Idh/MocA family oxidoreductase [Firmicutes bacterium]|nr:Gfo/Idh/MocA family oxidoreductase [Bacillota bacterium]